MSSNNNNVIAPEINEQVQEQPVPVPNTMSSAMSSASDKSKATNTSNNSNKLNKKMDLESNPVFCDRYGGRIDAFANVAGKALGFGQLHAAAGMIIPLIVAACLFFV